MLLSQLCREIDEAVGRFGDIVLAVGKPNGAWRPFSGLECARQGDEMIAALLIGEGRYYDSDMTAIQLRGRIEDFIADNGDMKVAVFEGGVLHTFIDLNVDSDVGDDGEDISVMIVQAYIVKASPRP